MTIDEICKRYDIKNYTINDDGSIDVDGDVWLNSRVLVELPLTFNRVSGYFNCGENELTTLKGSPRWVRGYFRCGGNDLTSLDFSPEYVGDDFNCSHNGLTTLKGSPKHVGGHFFCGDNENLNNITGCTEKIGKYFFCDNTRLYSIFNVVDQFFLHAFNFYKVIKDDTVNLKRLRYVMDLYDKRIDLEKIEKYYRIV
jgi:hypothetical protein